MKAKVYTDGRGNAGIGQGAAAIQMFIASGRVIEHAIPLDGDPTNNEAEYLAVMLAIEEALQAGVTELEIFSDSLVIVNQLNDKYECKKKELRELRDKVFTVASELEFVEISWVPREKCKIPDSLCRKMAKSQKTLATP